MLLIAIASAVGITVGVTLLSRNTALLRSLEHWTTDWRTALLADRAPSQHPGLAVVLVDDDAVQGLPYRSPIDRNLLARLIETLDAAGARVIGLDFLFDQATEPEKDRQLLAAIQKAKDRVVIGTVDERVPINAARRAYLERFVHEGGAAAGYLNLRYELDRVVRGEADPQPNPSPAVSDSFAAAIAKRSGAPARLPSPRIAWLAPPTDGSDTFLTLPAAQLLSQTDSEAERKLTTLLLEQVKGRIALIGGDLSDQMDRHQTPLTKLTGELMPGVLIHAHAVAQVLDGRRLMPLDSLSEALLTFFMALLGFTIGWRVKASGWLTSILPVVLVGMFDAIFFAGFRTIIPYAVLAVAWIAGVLVARGLRWSLSLLAR